MNENLCGFMSGARGTTAGSEITPNFDYSSDLVGFFQLIFVWMRNRK
jgi:hypothetical protein